MINKLLKLAVVLVHGVFCASSAFSAGSLIVARDANRADGINLNSRVCVEGYNYKVTKRGNSNTLKMLCGSHCVAFGHNVVCLQGIVFTVTAVAADTAVVAFSGLKQLLVQRNVQRIENQAFKWNLVLSQVVFEGDSETTYIGSFAFTDCKSLQSICIPFRVKQLYRETFFTCPALGSITFQKGSHLEKIGNNAFSYCSSLQSIEIPPNVDSIGERALFECRSIIAVNIPDDVRIVRPWTFYNCVALSTAEIPASVETIGDHAFAECKTLSIVVIGQPTGRYAGLWQIGRYVFDKCTSLCSIKLPVSIEEIGEYAFHCCYALSNVEMCEGVIKIGRSAFEQCVSLVTLEIPASVENVGNEAFSRSGIRKITFKSRRALGKDCADADAFWTRVAREIPQGCEVIFENSDITEEYSDREEEEQSEG
jgi:hypothetical protein